MTFPTFAAVNIGLNSTAGTTSHSVNLPAGISAGDLLLVFCVFDGNPTLSGTLTTEYTALANIANGANVRVAIYGKVAIGSEGSTVALTTSASETSCFRTVRIASTAWRGGTLTQAVEVATAIGASATPDPPILNPTNWAIEDTLWIAGHGCDANRTTAAYPASYSANQYSATVSNAANGCGIALATQNNAAASDNPGTYNIGVSDDWVSFTLAIRPSAFVAGAFVAAAGVSTAASLAAGTAGRVLGKFSRLTSSRHGGRRTGTFAPRQIIEAGVFVPAAGISTTQALDTGEPRPAFAKFSRLTSSRHGGRRTGSFVGREALSGGLFVVAECITTTGTLQGGDATGPVRTVLRFSRGGGLGWGTQRGTAFAPRLSVGAFVLAGGSSVTQPLAGSGNGSAFMVPAAGTSVAVNLVSVDSAIARSLGRISRGSGLGWGTQRGVPFDRVTGASITLAAGLSTTAAMVGRGVWIATMTPAAGVSSTVGLGASSASATNFVPAAGTSTTFRAGGGITSFVPAAGTSTAATRGVVLTASMEAAAGTSTTGLAGASAAVASLVVATAGSTASAMFGANAASSIRVGAFAPAAGLSTTSALAGSSTARGNYVAAAGLSITVMAGSSTAAAAFFVAATGSTTAIMVGANPGGSVSAGAFVMAQGATVVPSLAGDRAVSMVIAAGSSATGLAGASVARSSMMPAAGASVGNVRQASDANNGILSMIMAPAVGRSNVVPLFGRGMNYVRAPAGLGGRPRQEMGLRPMTEQYRRTGTDDTYRS